jgi:hypothetical protein
MVWAGRATVSKVPRPRNSTRPFSTEEGCIVEGVEDAVHETRPGHAVHRVAASENPQAGQKRTNFLNRRFKNRNTQERNEAHSEQCIEHEPESWEEVIKAGPNRRQVISGPSPRRPG